MRGAIMDGPADFAAWALVPAALAPALSGGAGVVTAERSAKPSAGPHRRRREGAAGEVKGRCPRTRNHSESAGTGVAVFMCRG